MNRISTLLLLLANVCIAFAQNNANISGIAIDATNQDAIAYANAQLIQTDGTITAGSISNTEGLL